LLEERFLTKFIAKQNVTVHVLLTENENENENENEKVTVTVISECC